MFSGKLWKKGDGLLPFQRRWRRYNASILSPTGLLTLHDETTQERCGTLPLTGGGLAVEPDGERHEHQFTAQSRGGVPWRLKACSAQQLADMFSRLQRAVDGGELPRMTLAGPYGAAPLDPAVRSSHPGSAVWSLAQGAPTPGPRALAASSSSGGGGGARVGSGAANQGAAAALFSPHTPPLPPLQPLSPALQHFLQQPASALTPPSPEPAPAFFPRTPALLPVLPSHALPSSAASQQPSLFLSPDLLTPLTAASQTPTVTSSIKDMRLRLLDDDSEEEGAQEAQQAEATPKPAAPSTQPALHPQSATQAVALASCTALPASPPLISAVSVQVLTPEWEAAGAVEGEGLTLSPPVALAVGGRLEPQQGEPTSQLAAHSTSQPAAQQPPPRHPAAPATALPGR